MRIFQVSGTIPAYKKRLSELTPNAASFAERMNIFHNDDYIGVYILDPVLRRSPNAFFTLVDNADLQQAWAREKGLPAKTTLEDILLAQIEEHQPDVFYTLSTILVDSALARRMPSCVKAKIGHHGAPIKGNDMSAYLMVCNFPTLLGEYQRLGLKTAFFSPSVDPGCVAVASNAHRDIDVLFVGTYSRWHKKRSEFLEAVAALQERFKIVYCLYRSRLNRLAETPLGWFGPLKSHVRPPLVRSIARPPLFGSDYCAILSRAKIVLNGSIDIMGLDRGNMRCFETLSAGALLLSDAGNYPEGMNDGETMRSYRTPEEAIEIIDSSLNGGEKWKPIARAGFDMVRTRYSKQRQWADFEKIVAENF